MLFRPDLGSQEMRSNSPKHTASGDSNPNSPNITFPEFHLFPAVCTAIPTLPDSVAAPASHLPPCSVPPSSCLRDLRFRTSKIEFISFHCKPSTPIHHDAPLGNLAAIPASCPVPCSPPGTHPTSHQSLVMYPLCHGLASHCVTPGTSASSLSPLQAGFPSYWSEGFLEAQTLSHDFLIKTLQQ